MNQLLLTDAAFRGDLDEVKRLISEGYDVNLESDNGTVQRTPLDNAIENKNLDVIKFLLENGAQVNRTSEFFTPLHHAIDIETDQFVWENEAGQTLLPSAEITRLLVKFGADVNVKNESGFTPLDEAIRVGHVNAIKILREHGGIASSDERAQNL